MVWTASFSSDPYYYKYTKRDIFLNMLRRPCLKTRWRPTAFYMAQIRFMQSILGR